MTTRKKLGIWMDHSNAHLIEFTTESEKPTTITSSFTHQEKVTSMGKSENLMHNKEQHDQSAYYKKLGAVIKNYGEVILFGPTTAKTELFNILTKDHLFSEIKMEIKEADKMTENQQQAFVKDHFSKNSNPNN